MGRAVRKNSGVCDKCGGVVSNTEIYSQYKQKQEGVRG